MPIYENAQKIIGNYNKKPALSQFLPNHNILVYSYLQ